MAFLVVEGEPLIQGDMNADSTVSGLDIQSFVNTLVSPSSASLRAHLAADCNFDDVVDINDIAHFVAIVLSGAP
jgi:hypothetical protein